MHTYFLSGDYERSLEAGRDDYGYGLALALAMLGQTEQAIEFLKKLEPPQSWRLGKLYVDSLRALLEGNRAESLAASDELLAATLRDPEGWYYLARQLSYLSEPERAFIAYPDRSTWAFSAIRHWRAIPGSTRYAAIRSSRGSWRMRGGSTRKRWSHSMQRADLLCWASFTSQADMALMRMC